MWPFGLEILYITVLYYYNEDLRHVSELVGNVRFPKERTNFLHEALFFL